MDFDTEKKLRYCYSPILFDILKFNEILADKKFIKRLATDLAKMLFGYLKDIRFYLKFIDECAKRYPSFNIKKIRKNCIIVEDFTNEILYFSIKDKYNIKTLMEIKNMKFDVAIMNPPYGDSIHLELFDIISNKCNKTICVFPFTWCAKHNINLPKGKWREKLQGKIDSIIYYEHRIANDIFGTGNAIEDLAVVTTKENTTFDLIHYGFKNLKEYNLYKKIDFYSKDKCITMSTAKNKSGIYGGTAEMFRNNKPKFYVPIYQWHSGTDCYDACVIQDKNKINKGCSYFRFNNKTEKTNFEQSLKTNFMNWFYFTFIVQGDNKEQAYLFRMSDYSKPWDDKRFCEYFGITGYISDTEAEPNSEWETILNTIKEYV